MFGFFEGKRPSKKEVEEGHKANELIDKYAGENQRINEMTPSLTKGQKGHVERIKDINDASIDILKNTNARVGDVEEVAEILKKGQQAS